MGLVEGRSELLGGIAGRYPYDTADASSVVWPVALSVQKLHSQIDHDEDDDLLESEYGGYIVSAVEEVESRGQVSLIYQKRRQILDRLPSEEEIEIARGPLVQIDAVTYLDADETEQTLATSYYRQTKAGGIWFKDTEAITTACGNSVVWIDTVCGFGDAPEDVPAQWRQICQAIAEKLYDRRQIAAGGGLDDAFEKVIDRRIVIAGGDRRYV